jgi:hypothetical protein
MHSYASRKAWYAPAAALDHAGGLKDTHTGHSKYVEYLAWLMEDAPTRKKLRFETMPSGWVAGTAGYVKTVLSELKNREASQRLVKATEPVVCDAVWNEALAGLLRKLKRDPAELAETGKSMDWKLALAAALKARTTVTNRWLAANLFMGNPHEVSRKVSAWSKAPNNALMKTLR